MTIPFTCPHCGRRCEEIADFHQNKAMFFIEKCLSEGYRLFISMLTLPGVDGKEKSTKQFRMVALTFRIKSDKKNK